MFNTVEELVKEATEHGSLSDVIIEEEIKDSGHTFEFIWEQMRGQLEVMNQGIERGIKGVHSQTGLTGGDAKKIHEYIKKGEMISDSTILTAVQNAVGTNEVNASMGLICATPTAGSAGVVPGVLSALKQKYELTEEEQIRYLFVAGGFGLVIANNASISGAMGGCQAEIGSASAMASAACVDVLGGTPKMASNDLAMTIKNMLGLICDPVAGLVEVPCVKRNALGASQAIISADMALAGVESRIPADDVIFAMNEVGIDMDSKYKETAEGGLANTPTARALEKEIFE